MVDIFQGGLMRYPVYIDNYRPATRAGSLTFDLLVLVSSSLLIAALSQLEFFVPFSPVPVTGQTFAVLAVGLLLGSTGGASAVLLYLAEGSMGLPFFAGGSAGVHHFIGPTGGYLLGFVGAAYLAGLFSEIGFTRNFPVMFAALSLADLSLYIFGVLWLSSFVGREHAVQLGFFPFIFGDLVKILLLSLSFPLFRKSAVAEERT